MSSEHNMYVLSMFIANMQDTIVLKCLCKCVRLQLLNWSKLYIKFTNI